MQILYRHTNTNHQVQTTHPHPYKQREKTHLLNNQNGT